MSLCFPAVALSLFPAVLPNDWPHWRGPRRDGISTETDWNPVGAERPLWSKELGLGYSNVSIANGRLYTLGYDEEAGLDTVYCLDARSGDELWTHRYPSAIIANFHGGGSLTTPTIDGDVVYTTNREGNAFCFDAASGEVLWHRNLTEEYELTVAFHGFSGSPVVVDDDLFLSMGGTVFKLDKHSGELLWKTADSGDGGYSVLVPFQWEGRDMLYFFGGPGLYVLDRENGEQRSFLPWRATGGGFNGCTPLPIGDGQVFISTAYDKGCALLELDDPEPRVVWASKRMRNKVSSCLLFEDHIYGFDESMLRCLDLDGKEQWRVRGLGMGAPSIAGDKLIVLSSKGELIIAAASPDEFKELSRTKVLDGGVYWTNPVLVDGLIYCRNSLGSLICLDHRGERALADSGGADAPEPIADMPSAEALFAAHLAAVGGEERVRKHASLRLEGEMEITGAGITRTSMSIDMAAPNKWLLTYDLGQYGTVLRGYDGTTGWMVDPFYGTEVKRGDALLELASTRLLQRDADFAQLFKSMKNVGPREFGDRACWAVDVVTSAGVPRTVYFDRETGLKVGHESEREALVVYSDYQDFDGLQVATKRTYLIPETGAEETLYVSNVVFGEVDEALFALPDAIKRLLLSPEEKAAAEAKVRAEYADVIGTYVSPRGEILIRPEADQLVFAGDGDPYALSATEDGFRFEAVATITLRFERDEAGNVTSMLFSNRGNESEFPRK